MGGRAGRSRSGERLQETRGSSDVVVSDAVELIGAREVAGEEVENVVVVVVEAALECVRTLQQRRCIGELVALDGRLARAEEVAPDRDHGRTALTDDCL